MAVGPWLPAAKAEDLYELIQHPQTHVRFRPTPSTALADPQESTNDRSLRRARGRAECQDLYGQRLDRNPLTSTHRADQERSVACCQSRSQRYARGMACPAAAKIVRARFLDIGPWDVSTWRPPRRARRPGQAMGPWASFCGPFTPAGRTGEG
jgi:hypothetical protein